MPLRRGLVPAHDAGAETALTVAMPAQTALDWAGAALQRQLQPVLPGVQMAAVAITDSTSTQLVQGVRDGRTEPRLLVAEAQTAGRGRLGRRWLGDAGASLTFSLGFAFAPSDWSGLSLAVGAALADSIEPPRAGRPPRLQLKWPNDLWLAEGDAAGRRWRKLGGVLIETVAGAGGARHAVVGVGINIAPLPPSAELPEGAAGASELTPGIDAPALLAALALPLANALRRFEAEGFAAFAAAYARRDLLRGQAVVTTHAACPDGVAEGVAADGALLVRRGGEIHRVASGDVSVRPRGMVAAAVGAA